MTSFPSNLPKITIITPSYNQVNFIERTIESVLSQNYPDLEYIVMDGGSTDGTIEVLKKYSNNVVWVSEKDRGQSHAINKGIRIATGDVIAYLNSDDLYEPGALLSVGSFINRHPNTYWLTGKCRFIDQKGHEIRKIASVYKTFWLLWGSYTALTVLDYVSQPATFWHREVIDKVGNFDENLHYTMDYDFSLRVGKVYKLWRMNRYLARYRIHPTSKTFSSAASINAQFDEDLAIAKKNGASQSLLRLHALHNAMIIKIYRRFFHSSS
jgi:glycosyltransferase involved in cell wall biosynthesis